VIRFALVLLLAAAAVGCDPSARQRVLSANAAVVVETQPAREDFYARAHAVCLASESFAVYRECMEPSRAMAIAVDTFDRSLRAAQAALDASNQAAFQAMIPDLIRVAAEVVRALEAAGVPVPDAVLQIAALAGGN